MAMSTYWLFLEPLDVAESAIPYVMDSRSDLRMEAAKLHHARKLQHFGAS